ncbi:MAG: indole-3-glycerol phosphate synthase TrpC [Nitrososphaeria archaeon]
MPKELNGWLDEVVKAAKKRKAVIKNRERNLYDIKDSILKKKEKKLNPIIAEFKRSSPSGFKQDRDPLEYAKLMERFGAAALSILTEPLYFSGSYETFEAISRNVKLPLLFKDFVVTEAQVDTAYSIGADAVLLIVKILEYDELCFLYDYIKSYGMVPLVEVENENDLNTANACGAEMIGINARDLNSLTVNVERVAELLKIAPPKSIKVAESGIQERSQIIRLLESGADAFLIGTTLMKDPEKIKLFVY